MQNEEGIKIEIHYKLDGNTEWNDFRIAPNKYFDLDEFEQPGFDSVPFFNHAIDYIEDCVEKVVSTKVIISDEYKKTKRIINTSYWNEQKNSITERIDLSNGICESELIIETRIEDIPPIYEVMRIIRKEDILIPIYHGFFTDKDDGSQVERQIF